MFKLIVIAMFPAGGKLEKMAVSEIPFVMVDNLGLITYVNDPFGSTFGWKDEDLSGKTLDVVLPDDFRLSHHLAFSNFSSPVDSQVVGHPLILKTRCSDGSEIKSEHFIVAEKEDEKWFFGAQLKPLAEDS